MKKIGSYILIALFAVSICVVIFLTLYTANQTKAIESRDGNIATMKRLQKINDQVTLAKDSLLQLNEQLLKACNSQIQRIYKNKPDQSNVTGFSFGDKHISLEELLKITNSALKENQQLKRDMVVKDFKLKTMKEKFGLSFKDTTNRIILEDNPSSLLIRIDNLQNRNDSLKADLDLKKRILGLIDRNYHIPYSIKGGTITILDNRLDSLLDVYPLIKKRIRIKDGKVWLSAF